MLEISPTDIPEVKILATRWFEDQRGTFSETFNRARWREAGLTAEFIQDNQPDNLQVRGRDPMIVGPTY